MKRTERNSHRSHRARHGSSTGSVLMLMVAVGDLGRLEPEGRLLERDVGRRCGSTTTTPTASPSSRPSIGTSRTRRRRPAELGLAEARRRRRRRRCSHGCRPSTSVSPSSKSASAASISSIELGDVVESSSSRCSRSDRQVGAGAGEDRPRRLATAGVEEDVDALAVGVLGGVVVALGRAAATPRLNHTGGQLVVQLERLSELRSTERSKSPARKEKKPASATVMTSEVGAAGRAPRSRSSRASSRASSEVMREEHGLAALRGALRRTGPRPAGRRRRRSRGCRRSPRRRRRWRPRGRRRRGALALGHRVDGRAVAHLGDVSAPDGRWPATDAHDGDERCRARRARSGCDPRR